MGTSTTGTSSKGQKVEAAQAPIYSPLSAQSNPCRPANLESSNIHAELDASMLKTLAILDVTLPMLDIMKKPIHHRKIIGTNLSSFCFIQIGKFMKTASYVAAKTERAKEMCQFHKKIKELKIGRDGWARKEILAQDLKITMVVKMEEAEKYGFVLQAMASQCNELN
jgi:hypothetical protein